MKYGHLNLASNRLRQEHILLMHAFFFSIINERKKYLNKLSTKQRIL